jgi:hypothetical protein
LRLFTYNNAYFGKKTLNDLLMDAQYTLIPIRLIKIKKGSPTNKMTCVGRTREAIITQLVLLFLVNS